MKMVAKFIKSRNGKYNVLLTLDRGPQREPRFVAGYLNKKELSELEARSLVDELNEENWLIEVSVLPAS
jgi:hypothetical protein